MELTITENSTTGMEDLLENTKLVDQFTTIMGTISALKNQISALQSQVKLLEKGVKREVKNLKKEATKTKPKGNRKPSGFAVPTQISTELCKFMKVSHGAKMARTEVTQYIISYIKEKKLQDEKNGRKIKPDKALKSLLNVKKNEDLTYLNLQKYMNKHFVKV